MLTEEDFEKAEEAIKVVDDSYNNNSQLFAPSLSVAEKVKVVFMTRGTQTIPKITPMK